MICAILILDKGNAYSSERDPSCRQRRCYIRTMIARVQFKNSGHEPKGLGAKPPVVK
jgi:hypothetical protein